ncbi:hypothetical protein D3C81_748020 [compost metagenome]
MQPFLPESQGTNRNSEGGNPYLTGSDPAATGSRCWEEGHDGTRIPVLVTEVEMIHFWRIEVDGFFNQSESKHPCVKVNVSLRISSKCSNMMNS